MKAWVILFGPAVQPSSRPCSAFPLLLPLMLKEYGRANIHEEDRIVIGRLSPRLVAIGLYGALGMMFVHTANAGTATKEEIDAALKFYDEVKADSNKLWAYCEVKQAIGMMAAGQGKFAEAQQRASAASKQLGPEFGKAQSLQPRLDTKSDDMARYTAARHALDKSCP
jgi:hypothetical protein